MKPYLQQIGRFLLLLLFIQIVRGLILTALWKVFQPVGETAWAVMEMMTFAIVGVSLLLIFRPAANQLGLEWKTAPRWERVGYVGMGILTLLLLFTTYFLAPDLFAANLNAALSFPIFEELLFRGWGWGRLEKVASFRWSGIVNWLVISLLFGLWHFGYLDVYLLKMAPANPGMHWGTFFVMKFVTTFIIGLIVGVPRGWTGRVYGSLILHALVNIFGK